VSPTVGLASAVRTPIGVALQQHAQDMTQQEQLHFLAVHHRLTMSFNEEFSRNMNVIISVLHQACRVVPSTVFQYALDRLRLLRFTYFQLTDICAEYGEYQKKIRNSCSVSLPTVGCLKSSIQVMINSANTVTAVFRELQQWLSADSGLTVTERGLGLSNRLCHFVPVFMQEMRNFKNSLQMIVQKKVCASKSDMISSLLGLDELSAECTIETAPGSLPNPAAQLQENENVQWQNVEPAFVIPMPIVVEPEQPDEFSLIHVKQEPVEFDNCQLFEKNSLKLIPEFHHSEFSLQGNQLSTSQSGVIASKAVLAAAAHYLSSDIVDSANKYINSDMLVGVSESVAVCQCNSLSVTTVGKDCAGQLNVNRAARDFSSQQWLDVGPAAIDSSLCPETASLHVNDACVTDSLSGVNGTTTVVQGAKVAVGHSDESSLNLSNDDGSSFDNCLRSPDLNITCNMSALHNDCDIPNKETANTAASSGIDSGTLMHNTDMSNDVSDVSNLCTISSVCSIELEGFYSIDATEATSVDDIMSAVHAFDENAKILLNNVGFCMRCCSLPLSLLMKSVQKKKRIPGSKFTGRKKSKQQNKAVHSVVCKTSEDLQKNHFVEGNSEDVADGHKISSSEEMLNSAGDEQTSGNSVVSDELKCSRKGQVQSPVSASEDSTSMNGTGQNIEQCDTPQNMQSFSDISEISPVDKTDHSAEPKSECFVSVSIKAATETVVSGDSCLQVTGLESEKQDFGMSHPVVAIEKKCSTQLQRECRDAFDEEDRIYVSGKKKRAQVLYDDEDVENEVNPLSVSVSSKKVRSKSSNSLQVNDAKKKVKKFRSSNTDIVSHRLIKKGVLREKQSSKKVRKPEESQKQRCKEKSKVAADRTAVAKALRTGPVLKHNSSAVRIQKLKTSKQLLKRGIKQKTVCITSGGKTHANVNAGRTDIMVSKPVEQKVSQRLPKLQTVMKASPQSDNDVTVASYIEHSRGSEDQPRLSARDKVNAIFKNSEFTLLDSNTSLVHSKRSKPPVSAHAFHVLPPMVASGPSKVDFKRYVSPLKTSIMPRVDFESDKLKSAVMPGCPANSVVMSSAVCSTYVPVADRPAAWSSSGTTTHSAVSVKLKSVWKTSQMAQKKVTYSKLPSTFSLPLVSSSAANHTIQNTVPSLFSLKVDLPCFHIPKKPRDNSLVNNSIARSQSLNCTSAVTTAAVRDPRLAQRQIGRMTSQQQLNIGFSKQASGAKNCSGSMHWPWEQHENVTIPSTDSSNSMSKEERRGDISSHSHDIASCWAWETGENSGNVQNSADSYQWHSAKKFVHSVSPSVGTTAEQCQDNNMRSSSDTKSPSKHPKSVDSKKVVCKDKGKVPQTDLPVKSPAHDYVSEPGMVYSDILSPDIDSSSAINFSADFNCIFASQLSAAGEPLTLCTYNKAPGWKLIPLDLSGVMQEYDWSKKPLCEMKKCTDHASDPRLKTVGPVLSSSSLVHESNTSGSVDGGSDVDCQPVDLMSQQNELTVESKTLVTTSSLDSRIDMFVSHIDTFVDKNVEDEVNKLMSQWDKDQAYVEDSDSDVGDFVVIDIDDGSSDELLIDLTAADTEPKPEPNSASSVDSSLCNKTVSGHITEQYLKRHMEQFTYAETRTDRNILSDKERRPVVQAKESRCADKLQEHSNNSGVGYYDKAMIHKSGCHEQVKESRVEERGTEAVARSSNECVASWCSVKTTANTPSPSNELMKSSGKRYAEAGGEIYGNSDKINYALSTKDTHTLLASSNMPKPSFKTQDSAKSHSKRSSRFATSSSTRISSAATVSACLACLADVSEKKLGKLNLHMEARVKAAEQKIILCNKYTCPLSSLDELEKRHVIADGLAESAVVSEFTAELRLQSVQWEIDKIEREMAKIKSWFGPTCPSSSLQKKYDRYKRACCNLYVRQDWFYKSLNRLQRYHKSKFLLTVPDDLRFTAELSENVSIEGVPLILSDDTISLQHCTRLAAVLVLIKQLRRNRYRPLPHESVLKLGWLHQERKALLKGICCSSPQKVCERVDSLSEKLTLYKYVASAAVIYIPGESEKGAPLSIIGLNFVKLNRFAKIFSCLKELNICNKTM